MEPRPLQLLIPHPWQNHLSQESTVLGPGCLGKTGRLLKCFLMDGLLGTLIPGIEEPRS